MKTVFVSGYFDILHGGHIEFFSQARQLGDKLIVSVASNEVLLRYKNRKASLPIEHKKRLLESITIIDEVVIGNNKEEGLDFKEEFLRIRPHILAVTKDDRYGEKKQAICRQVGAEYKILPKTLDFKKVSTSEIVKYIRSPEEAPLRVDFAGGWLDVPKFARKGGYIVNCAIEPKVSLQDWNYEMGGGLGGSAAYAILLGNDGVQSELDLGVGWQDPAVIRESGLCVWESGKLPKLWMKRNPQMLEGKMALFWTGKNHVTYEKVDLERDFEMIFEAGRLGKEAVYGENLNGLCQAVDLSYRMQLKEGMAVLPRFGELAKKYCGGGWGGYSLYVFPESKKRDAFLKEANTLAIEPFIR